MTDAPHPDGLDIGEAPAEAFVVMATTHEASLIEAPALDLVEGPTTPSPAPAPAPAVASGLTVADLEALAARLETRLAPLTDLARKLDGVQASLDREGRAEATREKVVDRLHAELQEYKQDFLMKVMRPVFLDLIQLHDDMGKRIEAQADPDGEVARALRDYQQGIVDILYRQGVEPFYVEETTFDPRRQRAIQTVPTDEPEWNKQVAARHRPGFQTADKVVRPEFVSVYAYKK